MKNNEHNLVKLIGQRILSEANDLKRTIPALAEELNIPQEKFKKMLSGEESIKSALNLAHLMAENYPVSLSSLLLDSDDCVNSVKIVRAKESRKSSRIFSRKDKDGERTPYYEYRDTATSRISPFKPEWIKELRLVSNSDPKNPDVAYNNGHFLHQMTAFIGPVNFYWEVDGQKYCKEMKTGFSNYITPFWKHSFTTRDEKEDAIIIAVTFSGDVARARNELYTLGNETISSFKLDNRDKNRGTTQLIRQFLANNNLSRNSLEQVCSKNNKEINLDRLLDEKAEKSIKDLNELSDLLGITSDNFFLPSHDEESEVVVKEKDLNEAYIYNESNKPDYLISPLAKNPRMPLMNGFDIEIQSEDCSDSGTFISSLHNFVYNYGKNPINFRWNKGSEWFDEILYPEDSIYIQPFVKHLFWNKGKNEGKIFVFRVSGSINLTVQKELSSFASTERIIETQPWFN